MKQFIFPGTLAAVFAGLLALFLFSIDRQEKKEAQSVYVLHWENIGGQTSRAENQEVICYYNHGIWCHWKGK